ncbi:hypothetical protein ACFXPJ_07230 [Streptomyces goshikiensis]
MDLFWHAFVQRAVPYLAFSRSLGVNCIHHVPDEEEGGSGRPAAPPWP